MLMLVNRLPEHHVLSAKDMGLVLCLCSF
uniref:Uncharacterized protein n=1 Tax=Arundo donax TaxID=35708 RepID=A0A0A8YKY3_ARUDO